MLLGLHKLAKLVAGIQEGPVAIDSDDPVVSRLTQSQEFKADLFRSVQLRFEHVKAKEPAKNGMQQPIITEFRAQAARPV